MARERKAGPSKRESNRIFQYQGFWVGVEGKTGVYNIHWYDPEAGRTKRQTTGTRDLDKAKQKLIEKAQGTPPDDPQNPAVVNIATVRRFYFEHHVSAKRGGRDKVRDKDGPKRAFKHMLTYLASVGAEAKVADLTLACQQGFMEWGRDRGLSNKTISTYLSYIKAGLRFCSRPHLIRDARGLKREVQILSSAPQIDDSENRVFEVTALPKSKRREWVPTDEQLAGMFDAIEESRQDQEATFRYMIIALNTWARPEAIMELSVSKQVNFKLGTIDLNPPGRPQNKKVRPKIRLTDNLRGWLLYWNLDRPITYFDRTVAKVDNRTLRKLAAKAGIPDDELKFVNRYALRHYMATRSRRVQSVAVSREERAAQMGHVDPEFSTTETWYESFDPDYLEAAMRATDAVMGELNRLCRKRKLIAPTVANTTLQLVVVQGGKTGTGDQ